MTEPSSGRTPYRTSTGPRSRAATTTSSTITTSDLPETASGWLDLGREAGFSKATQLFDDPTDGLRIFRYDV